MRAEFEGRDTAYNQSLPRISIDWNMAMKGWRCPDNLMRWSVDNCSVATISKYINWRSFHHFWRTSPHTKEGRGLRAEAEKVIAKFAAEKVRGVVGQFKAWQSDDSIVVDGQAKGTITIPTPRQRKVGADGVALSLADFVAPQGFDDVICLFAITVPKTLVEAVEQFKAQGDDYNALLYQSISDRIVEAASEYIHREMRYKMFIHFENADKLIAAENRLTIPQLFAAKYRGIRPAVGYSCLPDQRVIFDIDRLIDLKDIGINLTESGAMYPQSSVCGVYITSAESKYFIIE